MKCLTISCNAKEAIYHTIAGVFVLTVVTTAATYLEVFTRNF